MKRLFVIFSVILLITLLFFNCQSPVVKNGSDGTIGPAGSTGSTGATGPGITWVDVTGTAVQAESNKGYLADSTSQVTITLPASPSFGDIIEVSGVGIGGWKIAQNANQRIITPGFSSAIGKIWTPRDTGRDWQSVASSSDGTKLAAVVLGGQIYTSTDSGQTWTPRDSTRNWYSVASSSDGTKLVAIVYGGQIYTSTDSGLTWTPRDSSRLWQSVASSSDGTKPVAEVWNGQIYTSTDSGQTWIACDSNRKWMSVASSSNGTKLAAVAYGSQIYTPLNGNNTTPGTSGNISGNQYEAVRLQYIGNNTFTILSHEGEIIGQ